MSKHLFLPLLLCALPAYSGIKSATILTEPSGEGQKITQLMLEYDELLRADKLPELDSFTVQDRKIESLLLGACIQTEPCHSHQLLLRLAKDDPNILMTFQPNARASAIERKPEYAVKQVKPITVFADSKSDEAQQILPNTFYTDKVVNQVLDEFSQHEFHTPSGGVLKYNLFVPHNYDPQKRYPLVVFMHDKGAINSNTRHTLFQGNGATVWASPDWQKVNPAFVLAPQFERPMLEGGIDSAEVELSGLLIEDLIQRYAIDPYRLYASGQSEGSRLILLMNMKYPQLFKASYLVAMTQTMPTTSLIARHKMVSLVSKDDRHSVNAQYAFTEELSLNGAQVQRAQLSNIWAEKEVIEQETASLLARRGNIYSLIAQVQTSSNGEPHSGSKPSAHNGVWKVAYDIDSIKEWLFAQ